MPRSVKVPAYIAANAKRGLRYYEEGRGGDGLVDRTIREAKDLASGACSPDKVSRMGPWLRRHQGDLDAPKNRDESHPEYPGAGLVAWLLWGGDANGSMRAAEWAEKKTAQLEREAPQNAAGLTQGGISQMEADTIESKHLAAVAQVDSLNAKVKEVEGLLTEAANAVKVAEEARNAAVAEKEALAASLADALAKVEKLEASTAPAEAQAAAIVAACKADPANVSPVQEAAAKEESLSVLERLNALPLGSKERAAFYASNKKAIWKAQAGI